ncbi:MAG: acyl-CoA thioesterase [Thermoanaerobaculum sp.]|nr:acyl-CoA thioesterase [Thermoanaerobaculum sp.]
MPWFCVTLRVRYAETDQMGVAHHAVYPVWFELARSELARARGLPYASWEERGYFLVVTEVRCRYLRPARYDELLTVAVRVQELRSRRVVFAYQVRRGEEVLAEGETHHVLVSRQTGRPTAFPPDLAKTLKPDDHC